MSSTIWAAVGREARRNDSVFPQQSWNSSQTRTGFSVFWISAAMASAADRGRASTAAMAEQKPTKSRRETPRDSSSCWNQLSDSLMKTSWVRRS